MMACMLRGVLLLTLLLMCSACATAPANSATPTIVSPSDTRILGQATVYISAVDERLEVVHDNRTGVAIVKLPDGVMAVLPAEIVGLEERYRDSHMTLWENEGSALLWIDGELVFSGREVN